MCGRTACTLDKKCLKKATIQYSKTKDSLEWIEKYEWQNYQPSYNLSPSQISPVLINDEALLPSERIGNYVIMPMRWGLIPSWYKGRLEEYSIKTNNCRSENILEKPTYRGAASAGFRCVILADGFYEWTIGNKKQKQPYFIYFPQKEGADIFGRKFNSEEDVWHGPRLLTMAGLFDIWKNSQNDVIYSYSVITMDSSKFVSFDRMPAILDGVDEVSMWLDSKRVPFKQALSNLKSIENLQMHPVSTLVNNSRNNSVECLIKKEPEKTPNTYKHTALTSWLQTGKLNPPAAKRLKRETDE